jgi:hypothetical protein
MRVGSRKQVMNDSAEHTAGGLKKSDLKMNKQGRIVSKSKSKPLKGKLKENEFYCVACRKKCVGENVKKGKARVTGQPMLKATCSGCENKCVKFVKA